MYRSNDTVSGSFASDGRTITINYKLPPVEISGLENPNGSFYRLAVAGHNRSGVTGKPELPVFSRLISLPESKGVIIKITDVRSKTTGFSDHRINGILYPRQADRTKQEDRQKASFQIDKELYAKKGLINEDTVTVEYIGTIRGEKIASLVIRPFRYNPYLNKLEMITSMKIEILFPGAISKTADQQSASALFSESLSKGVLNYYNDDLINGYSEQPVRMIILTDTAFKKTLEPYVTWKTQKGFSITSVYKGDAFAGSDFTTIKNTLSTIYNNSSETNPPPEYLLIVGDVNRIPTSGGTSQVSDLYWGEFDGAGDFLPDMYIGRLPVADTAMLRSTIDKIIQYEKFQFADTNTFYRRAMVSAGNEPSYVYLMNGQLKYAMTYYLNSANNIDGHVFYYPQSAASEDTIKKLVNGGVGFINYTGHGSVLGWLDPVIKVPEIEAFTNANMYPFVISNACQTARFSSTESMGNKMIVSKNKGAVGFIGCTYDSYWDEDYYWAVGLGTPNADPKYEETGLGALDRLFHTHNEKASQWYITMGQVNYAGNLAVSASTTLKKKYYWETYTLLGDPSVIPVIGQPGNISVNIPDTLPNNLHSITLTADPFAYAAISHFDTLWDASFVSPSGTVTLDLPGLSNDSCLLVITGQNKKPLIKKIYIKELSSEFINISGTVVSDPKGNNNNKADYGEALYLQTTISNLGLAAAENLVAKITTDSPYITLLKDTYNIGTLAGKNELTLTDKLEFRLDDLIPDLARVMINLNLKDNKTEKNYLIDITVHAPSPEIVNLTIDDITTGNGNLSADPGETVKLLFNIYNSGSSATSGNFNITSYPAGITIPQPLVATGIILPGESKNIPVTAVVSSLIPKGSSLDLSTILDCNPYTTSKTISLPIGKTRESFEYQNFTYFPWENSQTFPWIITPDLAVEGKYSARSAFLPNNSESMLKLIVNIPVADTLRFNYKVSSEYLWDLLFFRLNGTIQLKVSGEAGWAEKKVPLKEGFNTLEWFYRKDGSYTSGSDCAWLDFISFPAASFNIVDVKIGKIVTPLPNKSYTTEPITAEVINLGSDTLRSFNLAYRVNDGMPVFQNFVNKIDPADTATVAFTIPADLNGNGTYKIKVYGLLNNDEYILNDTATIVIVNTAITPVENPANKLSVMPNPFTESFIISLSSAESDIVTITVYDASGRKVYENRQGIVPGENKITITPGELPAGFYTLRVSGNKLLKAARLIKK